MLRRSSRVRTRLFSISIVLLCALHAIPATSAVAQLRGGGDRGRLGIFSGRREARFNRTSPTVVPYRANPNVVNPNIAPLTNNLPGGRPGTNGTPGVATNPSSNTSAVQSAGYAAADGSNPYVPSSGLVPPNRLPYVGPGVTVRLPRHIPGEVNYLIDNSEQLVVHPGEEQQLRLKGSYDVRFSRGVTEDGRSFGEGHYTITEGVYRFDLTPRGWELYRESDSPPPRGPSDALQTAQDSGIVPEPSAGSALQLPPANADPQPASFEETLPAPHPRSILER